MKVHADELAAATKAAAAATARQDAKAAEEAMEGHARELETLKKEHAKATDAMQRGARRRDGRQAARRSDGRRARSLGE